MEKKSNALTVNNSFRIAKMCEGVNADPELLDEIKDEMQDLDPESSIIFRHIKIPAGGSLAYMVDGDNEDDPEPMKTISGVIVFTHRTNGYWEGAYGDGEQGKIPLCSSIDGKTGYDRRENRTRDCGACPMNQFGSARDQFGNSGKGKACKNMRRLYIMMDGDPNFYLLTVPPTSIRDVGNQLATIMASGTPYTGLIVKLTLSKAHNAGGIEYSKVVIKKSGLLPPAVAKEVQEMRQRIKSQYQNIAITADDYAAVPERKNPADISADDFEDAPELDAPSRYDAPPPPSDFDAPYNYNNDNLPFA